MFCEFKEELNLQNMNIIIPGHILFKKPTPDE